MKLRLLLLLLLVPCAFATNETFLIQETDLPYNNVHELSLNLAENETAYITRVGGSLNVTHNDTLFFNSSIEKISFNITIPDMLITQNTTLRADFIINNTLNNVSTNYSLIYVIEYDYLIQLNDIDELNVAQGDYSFRVSSNNLPKKGSIKYNITGDPLDIFYLTCDDEVLVCPDFKFFDNTGNASLEIGYYLPYDYPLGGHNYVVEFRVGNVSVTRNIGFEIIQAELDFKDYTFNESCYEKVEGQDELAYKLDCVQDYVAFINKVFRDTLESARTGVNKSDYCSDYIVYEDNFVVVGNVSEDIYRDLEQCRQEKADFNLDYKKLRDNYDNLVNNVKQNETEVSKEALTMISLMGAKYDSKANELEKQKEAFAKEVEDERIKKRNWFIAKIFIAVILCGLIFISFRIWKTNKERIFG